MERRSGLEGLFAPPRRHPPHDSLHRKQPAPARPADSMLALHRALRRLAPAPRPQSQLALRPPTARSRNVPGMTAPLATHDFAGVDAALEFLKRTRWELRTLRKAHVWKDRLQVFDVNGDSFE